MLPRFLVLGCFFLSLDAAWGQPGTKKTDPPKFVEAFNKLRPTFSSHVSLPTNPDLERKLQAIPEYIQAKVWKEVTRALQEILDTPEDCFLPKENQGATQWVSVRAEANRLLGTLPNDGRQLYEILSGTRARDLLKQGQETGDLQKLADVALRYFHTQAGGEALDLLGTYYLDRGRYLMAAVCFDRLLKRPDADRVSAITLFKAALAFQRQGEAVRAEDTWNRLVKKAPDGLTLGERKATLAELKGLFQQPIQRSGAQVAAHDWTLLRGNPARTALAASQPLTKDLGKSWHLPTVETPAGRSWLDNAVQQLHGRGQPVLPGAVPLAAAGKVLFRTQKGLHAVDTKTGQLAWEKDLYFGFDNEAGSYENVSQWVSSYLPAYPGVLVENSTLGNLSSDGQRVYAVEDLAVPPFPNPYYNNPNIAIGFRVVQPNNLPSNAPQVAKAVRHNKLIAVNLATGKLDWLAGGVADDAKPGPLDDAYFLGPPLPLGGRLYSLIEKDSELRLVCLDPQRGDLVWTQPLIHYKKTLQVDAARRTWSAPLAYDQGILVCPSNAGAVVGVDLLTHTLVWAYPYLEEPKAAEIPPPQPGKMIRRVPIRRPGVITPPNLNATWKYAGPLLADGKVILAAPDASTLQCLSLSDGALLWKVQRLTDDHYVAGIHQDKLVIVGQQHVRAVSLKDGKDLWQSPTGMPSGLGVAAGKMYYLPVRSSTQGPNPAILAIDLETGQVVQRIATPNNEVPGNLVIAQGRVLSQTPTTMTEYAIAK